MTRRGAARHRPRLRRRPAWRCARSPARRRQRRQPPPPARRLGRSSPAIATDDPRVQDAYSLRCAPQVHGAARDAARRTPSGRRRRAGARRSTTRWSCPTAGSSRAATSTARPSRSPATSSRSPPPRSGAIAERRTDRLLDATRSHGLPPFLAERRRRQLRADDRPLHAGGDGRREPAARRAGRASTRSRPRRCRRTTSRWAGARPASCADRSPTSAGSSPSSWSARRAALDLRAPLRARPPAPRRRSRALRDARCPGPGPDRWLSPELAAAEALVARPAACSPRSRRTIGDAGMSGRRADRDRSAPRAGTELVLPGLAAGGGAADADEQPRPRGRRAPDDLVVYGGTGRAARSWEAFDAIVRDPARRSATTRRCSSSRASRSACSAPTSGRRGC